MLSEHLGAPHLQKWVDYFDVSMCYAIKVPVPINELDPFDVYICYVIKVPVSEQTSDRIINTINNIDVPIN